MDFKMIGGEIDATMERANITTPAILEQMAATFRERNLVYKDNVKMVGDVMPILHPEAVVLATAEDHELFHLWSLLVVKLTRFAISDLKHIDSIHDLAVYAAMIETILQRRKA